MTGNIPHPYPEGAARAWLDRTAQAVTRGLLRQYAVTAKDDDDILGTLSLRKADCDATTAELAYWLGRSYWGQGFVPEAASAALSEAVGTFALSSAWAGVLPGNPRSIRVLEKLGFERRGRYQVRRSLRGGEIKLLKFELDKM